MKKLILTVAMVFLGSSLAFAQVETFNIDTVHSSIKFKVRHFFAKTAGSFNAFSGTVKVDPNDLSTFQFNTTIDAASIDTANKKRDDHLRNQDFFHVEEYPEINFTTKEVKEVEGNELILVGTLDMHGVQEDVELEIEYHGTGPDGMGGVRNGFSAEGTLNRKDWGIVWNKSMDNGGVVLGEEVEVMIEIEGIKG